MNKITVEKRILSQVKPWQKSASKDRVQYAWPKVVPKIKRQNVEVGEDTRLS